MNWLAFPAVVAAIFAAGILLDRVWRQRRRLSLPWISDDDARGACPSGMDPNSWIETRRRLGGILGLEAERLSPTMRLDALSDHFKLLGISSMDLDGVIEAELVGVAPSQIAALTTVGDLIEIITARGNLDAPPL